MKFQDAYKFAAGLSDHLQSFPDGLWQNIKNKELLVKNYLEVWEPEDKIWTTWKRMGEKLIILLFYYK